MMNLGRNSHRNTHFQDENENEHDHLLPENSRSSLNSVHNHTKPYTKLVILLYFLVLIVDFGGLLQIALTTQIFETIIYQKFYTSPAVDGSNNSCKVHEVQSELVLLKGIQSLLGILPNLLLTIPYGVLINVYGRRTVLCLAMLGLCLLFTWIVFISWFTNIFPLRLIWLSSAFHTIGGGSSVAFSRAQVFFGLDAARLLAIAAGTATSSFLMRRGPWLPMFLALMHGKSFSCHLLRFDWSFARANLLTTVRASINLIREEVSHSFFLGFLRSLLLLIRSFSLRIVISSVRFGVDALLRSLLTSVIPTHEIGTFYTAVTLL
ncbi:hypothetical protein EYC80_007051 [Monilinia laxa]|uniref:Major facilitator superfamily (MFS) profile domain-containing protein n=1 Tax=Monilinia laxa TaxID=61186 RepID=A0A5N6K0E0_MONLA|nr:hypothetical protein EYC80_007051 [Monilinia laxa]